ncbi:MarR family transcriptional regulator [Pokkaliibacter plantistimulans]|uniref:MarR family transcriptional regulator n=1 Tax=Pokkaliibacter plantistimulans TaxID=1635171 RepID=A0ABX5LZ05_9GAMM|nr:MarR family transcriptional regulator [Pokkaliibacter plantistimulans]PXF31546.1 MarR family transcriptional regulator [Pokkaliibacter plantistimulans]
MEQKADAVDAILAQWRCERPELDVRAMATIGRLKRCSALMQRQLDVAFATYDLSNWEFDVLATLRRSGAPYCLAPTALFSTLMITSGTMTHRMQQLEKRGLIERLANPDDARSKLVQLTQSGLALIDRAVEAHVDNEQRILAPLAAEQLAALDQGLIALLALLEPEQPRDC